MTGLLQDLRVAARRLTRAPGYTAAAVITLTIGIGGNAAIFAFVHGILLRPLPYPQPDRIIHICEIGPEQKDDWCAASPANARDWTERSRTLQSVGLARTWEFAWNHDGRTASVRGGIATPGVFAALGVHAEQGRLFEARDLMAGGEQVALVSEGFRNNQLAGEGSGRPIELDGRSYEIVGVLPAGFEVPYVGPVDVWIPLWPERQSRREWRGFIPFARIADGASLPQARAEMDSVARQLAVEHPASNAGWGVSVQSLHERLTRPARRTLLVFSGAVGLVLLLACANVMSLMLARAFAREREHAVRLAIGASRFQVVRGMLSESLLLSIGGGLLGLLLAVWSVDLLVAMAPAWLPRLDGVQLTWPVLVFAGALCLVSAFACGLVPALHAGRVSHAEALNLSRTTGAPRIRSHTLQGLVVAEVALALVLLAEAGLLLRSFANLLDWAPGFDRSHVAAVQLFVSPGKYPRGDLAVEAFERAAEAVRSLPVVAAVGAGSAVPLRGGDGEEEFTVEGRLDPGPGRRPSVAWFDVDPEYFRALGIPLLRGRHITAMDRRGTTPVALVNETMARRTWPGDDPIGKRLRMLEHDVTLEIVGVVGDVLPFRPDEAPRAQIHWPIAQFPRWAVQLVVRTTGDPAAAASAISARLEEIDPDMRIGRITTMDELVDNQMTNPRFAAMLSAIFGAIALAIASVGVYGIMSFTVAQRTREIGIRMAMGADGSAILARTLRQGLLLAGCGVAMGLAAALALTRLLGSMLVDLAPTDPTTFVGVSILLLGVAAAACYLPARRAARLDPMAVLRAE